MLSCVKCKHCAFFGECFLAPHSRVERLEKPPGEALSVYLCLPSGALDALTQSVRTVSPCASCNFLWWDVAVRKDNVPTCVWGLFVVSICATPDLDPILPPLYGAPLSRSVDLCWKPAPRQSREKQELLRGTSFKSPPVSGKHQPAEVSCERSMFKWWRFCFCSGER